MREWPTATLQELADIRVSNVDKKSVHGEQPVRLCNYMDAYGNNYIHAGITFMEATATTAEISRFKVDKGDVLITKDSETPFDIGIPAVVVDDIDNLVCGYHLALLKPNRDLVDPVFLCKQLGTPATASYYSRYAAGSTRYGLSNRAVANTQIPLPSLLQQRKVAAVLTSIDTAIEKTEALIEKYQQIKAGLMHDLFTRGILPNGQLRSKEDSTQTKYGLLPNHWRLGSLLEATDPTRQPILTGPFGADLGVSDFVDDGVPVLRIGNVQQGRLDIDDLLFVTNTKARFLARYRIKPGDLLFARQGATTGRNALADDSVDGAIINYHIIRVALDATRCAPKFVETAFACEIVKRQVERDKGRGTREGINTAQLTSLAFPLAPLNEQREIADILESHNDLLTRARAELQKLRHQKLGLMQDLLTGKVPVKVAAESMESVSG